jgi:outer membrane protein OmpA-like peptidoglycan-associated protein
LTSAAIALRPEFRATLDKVAESLVQYPNSLIDVYGHTDSTGSDAFNQTLSENRARTVAQLPRSRAGAGGADPQPGLWRDHAGRQQRHRRWPAKNRRVEIKIVPVTTDDVQAARTGQ